MDELQIRAVITGILFGAWPLLMSRSGLNGSMASAAVVTGSLIIVLPFAFWKLDSISDSTSWTTDISWKLVVIASIISGLALLLFNELLSKATPKNVGSLYVLMIVVQMVTPAIYQVVNDGGLSLGKAIGFAAAIIAAILLL